MSIVTSTYRTAPASAKTLWIYEVHTDDAGVTHEQVWLSEGHDVSARLAEHAAELEARLIEAAKEAELVRVKADVDTKLAEYLRKADDGTLADIGVTREERDKALPEEKADRDG
jgi:hypothetical protein